MDGTGKNTKKFGAASFVCGVAGVILSILTYISSREISRTIFLVLGFAAAASAIVFANLSDKRETENKFTTAGFIAAVSALIICMSVVWFLSLFACLNETF